MGDQSQGTIALKNLPCFVTTEARGIDTAGIFVGHGWAFRRWVAYQYLKFTKNENAILSRCLRSTRTTCRFVASRNKVCGLNEN
jgi:hypothetical protein